MTDKKKSNYQKLINGESPNFAIWTLFLVGLIILCLFPFILTRERIFEKLDFTQTGNIGDTIGGITAPFIGLIGALLTFLAFWIQFKANKEQTKQFEEQDRSNKKERFETKFYDLLKLHRDNINEFNIEDKVLGRKCFIYMYSELRFCYCLIINLYSANRKSGKTKQDISKEQIFNIAYLTFFFGIGKVSDNAYNDLMKFFDKELITEFHTLLKGWQQAYSERKEKITIPHEKDGICEMKIKYKPFEGHVSRLGHYFRHLFQTVKFVIEQDEKIVPNKYEYIKTLRAQLSTHEQLLIYYNSLSILGQPWNEQNILTEYRFIKNIPLPYADFYKLPKEVFGELNYKGERLFEWDEITERLTK